MTIIEVGVAMSLTALIAGVAVGALVAVKRVEQSVRQTSAEHAGAMHLADRLRNDIHRASAATWDADRREFRLELPRGEVVAYSVDQGRAERRLLLMPAGSVADSPSSLPASDGDDSASLAAAYRLSRETTWNARPAGARIGDVVAIHFFVDDPSATREQRNSAFIVSAVVGRDQRMADK